MTDAITTATFLEVLASYIEVAATPLGPVSISGELSIEPLLSGFGTPADSILVTQLAAQALVVNEGDSTGVRTSQVAAEVLSVSDDWVRVSQVVAEVVYTPEFIPCTSGPTIGCTTVPVAYRLRIRNAADTADELFVTSLGSGEDAVIAEVPHIDGATFDPLTAKTTIGGCNVRVIDAASGAPGLTIDTTDRVVTKVLADATGRSQLLGRKAILEITADCATIDWTPHFSGFVTSLNLQSAIEWEIGLAHTTRDDTVSKVWAETDNSYVTARSFLMGGPVSASVPSTDPRAERATFEGYWKATVKGVYDTFIHLDINEDTSSAFPPSDLRSALRDRGWIKLNNDDEQRNVFRWAQGNLQKYFVRGFPSAAAKTEWEGTPTGKGSIRGYAPRVAVQFLMKNATTINHRANPMCSYERRVGITSSVHDTLAWQDLGNHFYVAWANTDAVAQPAVDDVLTFYTIPLDVSPTAPVWVVGPPAEILRDILVQRGFTVNAASVTATNTAVGDYQLALRVTEPSTVQDAISMIGGVFGLGVRPEADGTRSIFCWRVRSTPVATITLDDLADKAESWWRTEESSKVFSVSWKFDRFDKWPGQDQDASGNDRALDGIVPFTEEPITFQTGITAPANSRTQDYEITGCVLDGSGNVLGSTLDLVAAWSDAIMATYGDGAITTTIPVLPTVAADIGDEVILDLSPRPGFDDAATPIAQRGFSERALVIGRTPAPWGDTLTLLRVPETGDTPVVPAVIATSTLTLDDTITAALGTPSTSVVRLTLVDTTDWVASGLVFGVEYAVQSSAPAGSGTPWGAYWTPSSATFDLTGFTPGTTAWVRTRSVSLASGTLGDWSAWSSVVLDPTTSTTPIGTVQKPSLTASMSTGVVTADVTTGPEAVKVYATASSSAYPSSATILAGSTDTSIPFSFASIITLTLGQTGYIGVIAEDSLGNRSLPAYIAVPYLSSATDAPANAQYLTLATDATLTNERVMTAGEGITGTDAGAGSTYTISASTNVRDASVVVVLDGGGVALTTGVKCDIQLPFTGTVQSWTLMADQSGSIVIDVWKDTYANYPPTVADTITASAKPTISAALKGTSSTLTGWTTSVTAGDTLRFNVDSATTVQRVTLVLVIRKS